MSTIGKIREHFWDVLVDVDGAPEKVQRFHYEPHVEVNDIKDRIDRSRAKRAVITTKNHFHRPIGTWVLSDGAWTHHFRAAATPHRKGADPQQLDMSGYPTISVRYDR